MAKIPPQKPSENRVVYSEFGNHITNPVNPQPSVDLPPNQQQIRIQATRSGRKGKTVTVITGFQSSEPTLQTLLKKLKSQCGSGGTLKEQTIEIQGDHKQKLLEILTSLGYKAKISGG